MTTNDYRQLIKKINAYTNETTCESCGKKNYNNTYEPFLKTNVGNYLRNSTPDFFERFKKRCTSCFDYESVMCVGCGVSFLAKLKTFSGFCRTCDSISYAILNNKEYYYKENHHYLPTSLTTNTKLSFVPDKMLQLKYGVFLFKHSLTLPEGFQIISENECQNDECQNDESQYDDESQNDEESQNDMIFLANVVVRYPLLTNLTQDHIEDFCRQKRDRLYDGVTHETNNGNPVNYYITTNGSVCGGVYDCNNSPTLFELQEIEIVDK